MELIKARIEESIDVKKKILSDDGMISIIGMIANTMIQSINHGGKILFCGNGGSASDSLHLTGEIVGRFQKERKGMAAVSLNSDVATMTAVANDYGYDEVFARYVEGLMKPTDVLVGISTSGNSENIYRAILKAKDIGGKTVGLLGKSGGKIKDIADMSIIIPSDCTARIQESHIMIGHIICELIEEGCC
jgi:D-sedoheptulose 7-phosphate isomerase